MGVLSKIRKKREPEESQPATKERRRKRRSSVQGGLGSTKTSALPVPDREDHVEEEEAVDGNGSQTLNADQLEALITLAREQGLDSTPGGDGQRPGLIKIDEAAAIKLLNFLCQAAPTRMAELTDLNNVQAHLLPAWVVFEALGDPLVEVEDLHNIYRQELYKHRRSKGRWFPMQLLTLAGMQAEEEEFSKDMKMQGFSK